MNVPACRRCCVAALTGLVVADGLLGRASDLFTNVDRGRRDDRSPCAQSRQMVEIGFLNILAGFLYICTNDGEQQSQKDVWRMSTSPKLQPRDVRQVYTITHYLERPFSLLRSFFFDDGLGLVTESIHKF